MKPQTTTKVLFSALLLALISGAPRSWGYTNPIDGGSTETVTTLWSLSSDLYVGSSTDDNTMIVTNSGQVHNEKGYIGDMGTSDNNTVLVTGSGTIWSNRSGLYVGNYGSDNALTIESGGHVYSSFGYLGYGGWSSVVSSDNTVLVTGSGSVWHNSGLLVVGNNNGPFNSLTISDGGQVFSDTAYIGAYWDYPNYEGSLYDAVRVEGAGSVWSNSANLYVGYKGHNHSLRIADGGRVYNNTGYIGYISYSEGNVLVTGSGSVWNNSESLHVGRNSDNTLTVENGGWVLAGTADPNQLPNIGNHGGIAVGGTNALNEMTIANSSVVNSDRGFIGIGSTEAGSVSVSGSGSQWNNSSSLEIGTTGGNADNTLTVANGATVSAAGVTIHDNNTVYLKSGGTLKVSGGFANANLHMYISGASGSDYGHLQVDGAAELGGSLQVVLDGFTPNSGDVFNLFDWNGTIAGSFSTVELPPLSVGLGWNTSTLYTTGDLTIDDVPYSTIITNYYMTVSGFVIEWVPVAGNDSVVGCSGNLVYMPFTNLSTALPYPVNIYTDTVHGAASECFYKVEILP